MATTTRPKPGELLRQHGGRDAAADDADVRFMYRHIEVRSAKAFALQSGLGLWPPDGDLDRPADLALDHRAITVVVGFGTPEVQRHQVTRDVLAGRSMAWPPG